MKVYNAVARGLVDSGQNVVFGLIGDGNLHYVTEFTASGGRYVGAVGESAAVSMADGYARVSGRVGIVSVTHGPAATNTVTAMVEAVRSNSPVVLITGPPVPKKGFAQHIDLPAVFSSTGADYHRVLRAEHVVDDIASVLARVAATRRPTVLEIPHDMMHEDVEYLQSRYVPHPAWPVSPAADSMDEALGMLAAARRPIVLAGRGAVLSNARDTLIELADTLGAPLATTASAKDFFDGHPYNLGIMGGVSTPLATDVIAKSDCLASFGVSFSRYTTLDGDLTHGRKVIQCDTNLGSVGRLQPVDAALNGDADLTARVMIEQLQSIDHQPSNFRVSELGHGTLDRDPRADFRDRSTATTIDPRTAMIRLNEVLPSKRTVVTDVGRFVPAPWRYLRADSTRHFAQTGAFASIGLGAPAAIGAAVASPGRLTVGVAGDGGLMMSLIELSTAVRHQIPLLLVVLNDKAYGAEYDKFIALGYDAKNSFVDWPSFAEVAIALGCDGRTIRSIADLDEAVAGVEHLERPLLLDIRTDPSVDPLVP